MLRDRFKQRCLKRAERARAKAHASKRKSGPNSDVFNEAMDDDGEDSDGDLMQDEVRGTDFRLCHETHFSPI